MLLERREEDADNKGQIQNERDSRLKAKESSKHKKTHMHSKTGSVK